MIARPIYWRSKQSSIRSISAWCAPRSGEEALQKLEDEEFAVILMDVRMPGMDGLRTAEVICQRESAARIPIIFLTAVSIGNADVVSGYARGAVDFLL